MSNALPRNGFGDTTATPTLESLLDHWNIFNVGWLDEDFRNTWKLDNWYAIKSPDDVIAIFRHEADAARHRLAETTRTLNPLLDPTPHIREQLELLTLIDMDAELERRRRESWAFESWWAVENDGVVAYFKSDADACRFRLAEINRALNG